MNPSPVPKKKPVAVTPVAVARKAVPKVALQPQAEAPDPQILKALEEALAAKASPAPPQPPSPPIPSQPADPTERAKERMVTKDLVNQLRRSVDRNTRRWKFLIIMEALGVAIAIPVGGFLLALLLDNLVHLSTWSRLVTCLLLVGGVGFLGYWFTRRWRAVRLTEDQVALAMERQTPGAENRLINSLQIARDSKNQSPEFEAAIVNENFQSLKKIHVHQATQMRPALIRISVAMALVLVGVGFWTLKREIFYNSSARIFKPFTKIQPIYRTELIIEPGNAQSVPGGDVTIQIRVKGEKPGELTVQRNSGGKRSSDDIPINPNGDVTSYTFKNLDHSLTYWVKGGDFTSDSFAIEVPTPPQLNLIKATLTYPEYTHVPPQKIESSGGDLEALFETRAALTFILDQPADQAFLLVEKITLPPTIQNPSTFAKATGDKEVRSQKPEASLQNRKSETGNRKSTAEPQVQRIELKKNSPTEFSGEIEFRDVLSYQVEVRQEKKPPQPSPKYSLRVLSDQAPQLGLSGLGKQVEVQLGAVVPLKATASDDYGLTEVALFSRKVITSATTGGTPGEVGNPSPPAAEASPRPEESWHEVAKWPAADLKKEFSAAIPLVVSSLGAIEGEKVEVVLRGKDADPHKGGRWTSGESYVVMVGGQGAMFQVLYEQILQSEADLKRLIGIQEQGVSKANDWIGKLDPASGMRWDDQKNLDMLAKAMRDQAREQEEFHQKSGQVAREMVAMAQTDNFRNGLGMLADLEVTRSVRILEAVPSKDTPQSKRATLTEGRMKEEQIIRSLQEMLEQYVNFRQDWELGNMTPFIQMLGERQGGMRDESVSYKDKLPGGDSAQILQKSANARQGKLLQLSSLAQTALAGIGERVGKKTDPLLGKAFIDASASFESSGLKVSMQQAGEDLGAGRWGVAEAKQAKAAEALADIHLQLKKAAVQAAMRLRKILEDKAKTELAGQKKLRELQQGTTENVMSVPETPVKDIVHMLETMQKKEKDGEAGGGGMGAKFEEWMKEVLIPPDNGMRPSLEGVKLASKPGFNGDTDMRGVEGLKAEKVPMPNTPEKVDNLRGALLDEIEKEQEKFSTLVANSSIVQLDPGEIKKMGGRMNSFAASAKSGNQKPPPDNVGGRSRPGKQGARANGEVAGDESANQRGRDKAQEGDENVAEQAGKLKETKTEDMQKDNSTGSGGKAVDSKNTKFSDHDAGEWKDENAKKMGKPQQVNQIVERQGKPLDPMVAAMMRDLNGAQMQVIERVNALKKELKNVYLPTDALDDKINQLNNNLDKLKERPNPELFRIQQQTIDQLRGEIMVFDRAVSTHPPSVPREKRVNGSPLDEPAWQTTPGYENAVKYYYEKLSTR